MMNSTPKSKLSRSRRENHAPSADSNDSEKDFSFQSSSSGDSVSSSDSSSEGGGYETFQKELYAMMKEARKLKKKRVKKPGVGQKAKFKRAKDRDSDSDDGIVHGKTRPRRKAHGKEERAKEAKQAEKKKKKKKGTKAEFIRVDRLWSKDEHRYVLKKSSENTEAGEYEQYAFNVRRMFDWENKHSGTCLGIMSKPLKAALRHIMGEVKGISLEEDSPCVDPNTIFLFLEELRAYMNDLRAQSTSETKREKAKETALEARHLKVLIKYLDKDYDEIKKSLYPLLESRKITFDLLWALFKSNETAYAPTYDTEEEPRAFKVDYANLVSKKTYRNYLQVLPTYLK